MWWLVLFVVLGVFSPRVSSGFYDMVPNDEYDVSQIYCVPLTCTILMCDKCMPGSSMKYCECCETCRQMEINGQMVTYYQVMPVDHIILDLAKIYPMQNGHPVKPRPGLIIKTMFAILNQLLSQNMASRDDMYQLKQVLWDLLEQVQDSPNIHPNIGVLWHFLHNLMQSYLKFANSNKETKRDLQGITNALAQLKEYNPIDEKNKFEIEVLAEAIRVMYRFDIDLVIMLMQNLIKTIDEIGEAKDYETIDTIVKILTREKPIMTKDGPVTILTIVLKEIEDLLIIVTNTMSNPLIERIKRIITILKFMSLKNHIDTNSMYLLKMVLEYTGQKKTNEFKPDLQDEYLMVLVHIIQSPERTNRYVWNLINAFISDLEAYNNGNHYSLSMEDILDYLLNFILIIDRPDNPLKDIRTLNTIMEWLEGKLIDSPTEQPLLEATIELLNISAILYMPQNEWAKYDLDVPTDPVTNDLILFLNTHMAALKSCNHQVGKLGISECALLIKTIHQLLKASLANQIEVKIGPLSMIIKQLKELQYTIVQDKEDGYGPDLPQLIDTLEEYLIVTTTTTTDLLTSELPTTTLIPPTNTLTTLTKCESIIQHCETQHVLLPDGKQQIWCPLFKEDQCDPFSTFNIWTHRAKEFNPDNTWIYTVLNDLLMRSQCAVQNQLEIIITEYETENAELNNLPLKTDVWQSVSDLDGITPMFKFDSTIWNYNWLFKIMWALMQVTSKPPKVGHEQIIVIGLHNMYFSQNTSHSFKIDLLGVIDDSEETSSEKESNESEITDKREVMMTLQNQFENFKKSLKGENGNKFQMPFINNGDIYNINNYFMGQPPKAGDVMNDVQTTAKTVENVTYLDDKSLGGDYTTYEELDGVTNETSASVNYDLGDI